MNWEAVTRALTDTMRGAELSAKCTDDPMRKLEAKIVSGVAASLANAIQRGLDKTADLPATDAQSMQNEKAQALVEAAIELIAYCETGAWPSRDPVQKARAALAAIKEGQDDVSGN